MGLADEPLPGQLLAWSARRWAGWATATAGPRLLGAGGRRLEPGDGRAAGWPGATGNWPWRGRSSGIGEATYGVIAPTILLDLFAREQRSRLLSAFYLAMPIGSAAGDGAGGVHRHEVRLASRRSSSSACPGLAAALVALFLPEPVRGASEKVAADRLREHERAGATREDYLDLMVNSSYTYSVFGMAAYTFAIGGMLVWVPTFLFETRGFDQARAGIAPRPGRRSSRRSSA